LVTFGPGRIIKPRFEICLVNIENFEVAWVLTLTRTSSYEKNYYPFLGLTVTAYAANAQTQFQSNGTGGGDWSLLTTWQQSTDGGNSWNPALSIPSSSDGAIHILSGDVVM